MSTGVDAVVRVVALPVKRGHPASDEGRPANLRPPVRLPVLVCVRMRACTCVCVCVGRSVGMRTAQRCEWCPEDVRKLEDVDAVKPFR